MYRVGDAAAVRKWGWVEDLARAAVSECVIVRGGDLELTGDPDAHSEEVRVPLLDHTIIEALTRLREATRFSPLGQKMLLRELGLKGIDPSIFDRPKSGFVLPLDVWCRRRLSDVIDATFADAQLSTAIGLRPEAVGQLWRSYQAGAPGLYWSRIWSLFVLLSWCRRHGVSL